MTNIYSATPSAMISGFVKHRRLVWELAWRDFAGRYKGSFFGVLWSLISPLIMLCIYTLVFSVAFKAKWGSGEESKITFAIILFSGIIISNLFSECLNRAPALVVSHQNYVKKVVFPLEILPWMALFSALIHFIISFIVLIIFCILADVKVHSGVLLMPIVLMPLIFLIMGLSWIFASLGVYLRDVSQAMGMITTVTLFLAPVFYPIDALPSSYQSLLLWNPITLPVIQLRDVMLWDKVIQWGPWSISLFIGLSICQIGYWWFQKSRQGFADVI